MNSTPETKNKKARSKTLIRHRLLEGLIIIAIVFILASVIWQRYTNNSKPFPTDEFSSLDACVAEKVKDEIVSDHLVTNGMVDKFKIIGNTLKNGKSQIEKNREAAELQKQAIGQLKTH